jgi:hypothetical protein
MTGDRAEKARRERHETPTEQLDRNWADLLQELRVVQTGVQLLTGLLFTAVFQSRFADLTSYEHAIYLITVYLSTLSTALLITPVALHRGLFRQHARGPLVSAAQLCAVAGLVLLGLAVTGVVLLIFTVTAGRSYGVIAATITAVVFAGLWAALPLALRRYKQTDENPAR